MNPAPHTDRQQVVEVFHGVEVADPYRWLENGDDPAVRSWVDAQNEYTRQTLDALPDRKQWHERLVAFMGLASLESVTAAGDTLFSIERPDGADQMRLVARVLDDHGRIATSPPVVLADPAADTDDGAAAIDWFYPTPDGSLVAVGVSEGGTENSTLSLIRRDGTILSDRIPDCRASVVAWDPDLSGFLYIRYAEGSNYQRQVRHHTLGADPETDPVIFDSDGAESEWVHLQGSPRGTRALVAVNLGWSRTDWYELDRSTGDVQPILVGVEATTSMRFRGDDELYAVTTLDAPHGRVLRGDLSNGAKPLADWDEIVAESDVTISDAMPTDDHLYVHTSSAGRDHVELHDLDGAHTATVALPSMMSVASWSSHRSTGGVFAVVGQYTEPPSVWRFDSAAAERLLQPASTDDLPDLVVDDLSYQSSDGAMVPIKIIRRADVDPDDAATEPPTILYGYGGFRVPLLPGFSPRIHAWCAAGGQYAIAALRGGTEFGSEWFEGGRRERKQQTFDDFHAAAEWLVSTGRTTTERLAAVGGSNGGLLVGAAITQRPELYGAAWSAVPLLDMIRFPNFLIARLWTPEYGDPEVAEEFSWLIGYSPYHRVRDGVAYPPTILTTAEGDTRVDAMHARKMAAALQHATSSEAPVLLRQEGRAGHGQGKPVSKRAAEEADTLGFLWAQMVSGSS